MGVVCRCGYKMDQLLQSFQGTFTVSLDQNDPNRPHPRLCEFKFKREGYGDQETRRQRLLKEQKSRRQDYADYARRIVEGEIYSDDDMEEGAFDEVDGEGASKKSLKKQKSKVPYKNQLMLSEWLVDIPSDFEHKWYVVVCPIAKRCLVISHGGNTIAYSRSGHFMKQFPSHLPGGCRDRGYSKHSYCVLDCLFHEGKQTFFVLDIMCWGGHPVYDSDTEFRFYWLNSKLSDLGDDILMQTRTNPYQFVPLQYHTCSKDSLQQILSVPWPVEVDGLLFFHKEAHYFRGRSPLVLWLKPHMVPDLLHVPVSQEFLACAPISSDSVAMDTDKKVKKKKHRAKSETMEIRGGESTSDTQMDNTDEMIT